MTSFLDILDFWLASWTTFAGEQTDGRCGLDPWGCPAGELGGT